MEPSISEKIKKIKLDMIKMFEVTYDYLKNSFKPYLENDAKEVVKVDDSVVDSFEREIEKSCLAVILKERPFARDLREVTGIFKMVEDVERLGDHAEDIVWVSKNLFKEFYEENPNLIQMIKVALNMVENSYKAYINENSKLAEEIIKKDDIVDNLYLTVIDELTKKTDKNINDNNIVFTTLMAKYVERIADHASNIAEWVIYIINGYYKDDIII